MNITPHINPLPVATAVNPPTDNLRRENVQRPIITAPAHTSGSPAEKGAADKEKASVQVGEQFNFTELQKSAEKNANQISEQSEHENRDGSEKNAQSNEQEDAHEHGTSEGSDTDPSSAEAKQHVQEILHLKQRDQEVRTHEQAHAAVGGAHTGMPSYEFEVGPDGKKYAVAGEVSVDLSSVEGDPQATITKMEQVYAAALAPAEPSAQDHRVAAQASELMAQAQADLAQLAVDEYEGKEQSDKVSPFIESNNVFKAGDKSAMESQSFDEQMSDTLKAQESIAPSISNDIKERAHRIEGYYSGISQAYEKAPSHQFELMV